MFVAADPPWLPLIAALCHSMICRLDCNCSHRSPGLRRSGTRLAAIEARRKEEAMRSWSMLSTVALFGILTAVPAYANDSSVKVERPYDRLSIPYGDALTQSDL